MKWVAAQFIALVVLHFPASSQTDERGSFSISQGSTFSASGNSKSGSKGRDKALAIDALGAEFREVLELIRKNHVSGSALRQSDLMGSAIRSSLSQLDPHSNYLDPDEFRELNDDHRGRYQGIGTTMSHFEYRGTQQTFILSVGKGTPAENAGLRFGDRIVAVNGVNVAGLSSLRVRDLVRGPINSFCRLSIERSDGTFVDAIPIRRARVAARSINAALMIDANIGFISLTDGFDDATAAEFDVAFRALKQRGMSRLVIDLRGNGGGLMEQAISIAEKFLPAGYVIVKQRGRYADEEREWLSRNRAPEMLPIALLVDGGTASASEILAATMQDHDRAAIIGERTFGKGLVQSVIPLEDGSGITLTSERYFTPAGRTLQREYSDRGLYDYFKHVDQGILIDKPEFAAKTRNGRVVFGGDGISPDVTVKGFGFSAERSMLLDRLFGAIRNRRDHLTDREILQLCEGIQRKLNCKNEVDYMKLNAEELYALRSGNATRHTVDSLSYDPQVAAAIRTLKNSDRSSKPLAQK